jgi:cardiolipin synthase C
MHNKAFTVDKQVTVVGGRNIGDACFGGNEESSFVDLDVLAVGPVAQDVATDFERYCQSPLSYPAADFLPATSTERQRQCIEKLEQKTTPPHPSATGKP